MDNQAETTSYQNQSFKIIIKKLLRFTIVFSTTLFILTVLFPKDPIDIVKQGYFDNHPHLTVEEASEQFMSNVRWSSEVRESDTIVNLEGEITSGKEIESVILSFVVDEYEAIFKILSLKIGNQIQEELAALEFIDTMLKGPQTRRSENSNAQELLF